MPKPHRRTAVFDAVLARIRTIPAFADPKRAERGRTDPIPQEILPAVSVTWADDDEAATVRPQADGDRADGHDRVLPVSVIVHLRADDPETVFDDHAFDIEAALAATPDLGGVAIEAMLISSRFFVEPMTGRSLAAGRLVYRVHYATLAADPGTAAIT